jgi:hypothetical protein
MSLQSDINNLGRKASRGDVFAGLGLIMELTGTAVLGLKFYGLLLAAKAALVAAAPWTAPVVTPAMIAVLMRALSQQYAALGSEQRRVISTALGWLIGRVKI